MYNGESSTEFQHPFFRRGREDLLCQIIRKENRRPQTNGMGYIRKVPAQTTEEADAGGVTSPAVSFSPSSDHPTSDAAAAAAVAGVAAAAAVAAGVASADRVTDHSGGRQALLAAEVAQLRGELVLTRAELEAARTEGRELARALEAQTKSTMSLTMELEKHHVTHQVPPARPA